MTPGKSIEASGQDPKGLDAEGTKAAVGRQADAPSTLVTPSLLSDSREAISERLDDLATELTLLGNQTGEQWIADASTTVLDARRILLALSLPQTGVEAGMSPEAFERAPKHHYWGAGEPDCPRDIKAGNGELHTMRCKICELDNPRNPICHADALFARAKAEALTPKVIDRDIEGETIGTSISGAMLTAMQAYNPRLYGEEKWETTLANIEPFIRKAARSIFRPIEAALRPFAAAADLWDEMGDTRPIDEDGKLTVADLRRARSAIRALASPSLHGDGK